MFSQDVRRAHHSENHIGIQRFYMRTFDSFGEICALFKVSFLTKIKHRNTYRQVENEPFPGTIFHCVFSYSDVLKQFLSILVNNKLINNS